MSLSMTLSFEVRCNKLLIRMEKKIMTSRLKQYFSNPEKSAGGKILSCENISPLEVVLQFEDDAGEHSIILAYWLAFENPTGKLVVHEMYLP